MKHTQLTLYLPFYQVINVEQRQQDSLVLTQEGEMIASNGSYEATLYSLIPDDGLLQAEMKVND